MRGIQGTIVLSTGVLTGCMALMNIKQVNFVHSSLDFNKNAVHRTKVAETDPATIVRKVTALGEKRDLILVSNACAGGACDFEFKRKPVEIFVDDSVEEDATPASARRRRASG